MSKFYPVSSPVLNGNEREYVLDCIDTTWISSNGKYINQFEERFANFCETKHAMSCSNGTTALHLALLAHGVQEGDEVIVPTFTYIATANAVKYCGATPVFVDIQEDTWNLDPTLIESKVTDRTRGIIVVHLYGHPVDMDPIMELAQNRGLFVIEDAAEAIGALYKGHKVGSLGHTSIFSLFGNKIITTGEGGMVTTNDDEIAKKIRQLKGQGMDPNRRYWFPMIGYNYRMTNIQAAIGLAQLENIEWHLEQRIRIAMSYESKLRTVPGLTLPVEKSWAKNVYWMYSIVFTDATEGQRDAMMQELRSKDIETRPFFYPMHVLPPYTNLQPQDEFRVATRVAQTGINLPTYGALTEGDIQYICDQVILAMKTVLN